MLNLNCIINAPSPRLLDARELQQLLPHVQKVTGSQLKVCSEGFEGRITSELQQKVQTLTNRVTVPLLTPKGWIHIAVLTFQPKGSNYLQVFYRTFLPNDFQAAIKLLEKGV